MDSNRGACSATRSGAAGKPAIELFTGASQLSLLSAQTAGQAGTNWITQGDFSTPGWQAFTGHLLLTGHNTRGEY
jgi:hypothetical protein